MTQLDAVNRITESLMAQLETIDDIQERYNAIKNHVMSAYVAGITYVQIIDKTLNKGNN